MNRRVVVALIGVFVVGALIGVVVALAANSSSDSDDGPAGPSAEECAEAVAFVDASNERFDEIAANSAAQDATFLAGLLTEQGAISYVMGEVPACFTLTDRASAAGLLGALEALLAVSEIAPIEAAPSGSVSPGDLAPDPDEPPPTTDPGE